MSNGHQDPVLRRLQALQEVSGDLDPVQRRLALMNIVRASESLEPEGSALGRFARRLGSFGGTLTEFLVPEILRGQLLPPTPEEAQAERAKLAAAGSAFLAEGIANPLANLLEAPEAFTGVEIPGTAKTVDFLRRFAEGLKTNAEDRALDAGLTPEQMRDNYNIGGFVGLVAPISASVKIAHLGLHGVGALQSVRAGVGAMGTASVLRGSIAQAIRAAPSLRTHIAAGDLATDFVAGAVFGGLFRPGDEARERLKHMSQDSALFGVTRIVLSGLIPTMRVWRSRRGIEKQAQRDFERNIKAIEDGRQIVVDPDNGISMIELMNEENYIIHSPAAQNILQANAVDNALVTAIKDLAETRGSAGIFRASMSGEQAGNIVRRFSEQFPGLKIERIKRSPTQWDIYFGTKGLNNKQRAQLKKEGRFEGQVLQHGGSEVFYRGTTTTEGVITVKNADGKVFAVKEANVTDTPFIREEFDFTPDWDALYLDFEKWLNEKVRTAHWDRPGVLEADVIEGIRTGKIQIPEEGRRAFDLGGALMHPEELGIGGLESIRRIEFTPVGESSAISMTGTEQTVFATRGIVSGKPATGQEWRINVIDARSGTPTIHYDFATFDEMVKAATEDLQLQITNVVKSYPTGSEVQALITQGGLDAARLVEPPPVVSFERAYDLWAAERGIPKGAIDYVPAKHAFGDRYRRNLWEQVPPGDRQVYESLLKEQQELLSKIDLPIENIAATKGFSVERLEGGAVRLREIQTGMTTQFGSEKLVRDALKQIVRPERDMPDLIASRFDGLHTLGGGYPAQDLLVFSDVRNLHGPDLPFKPTFRNQRDWSLAVERQTGIPIWSQGMDRLDQGHVKFISEYMPEAENISRLWKEINNHRQRQLADFWATRGEIFNAQELTNAARAAGFNAKEIRALIGTRSILDQWVPTSGISPERYINQYFNRVRPFAEKYGALDVERAFEGMNLTRGELEFWTNFSKEGEMALVEKSPELIAHKFIRSLLWRKNVKPHWDNLAMLTGTRHHPPLKIKDLPIGEQQAVINASAPGTTPDSPVLPREIRDVLTEYLTVMRGMPGSSRREARGFLAKLLGKLGVKTDPRVGEEFVDTMMSMGYGAAMGLRLAMVMRNMTQTVWLNYARFGGRHMGRALESAMTDAGFREVVGEGAIALREASGILAELNLRAIQEIGVEATGGPFSMALASVIRRGLRAGSISREFARRTLIPYSSSDEASRAWSYFNTKFHVEEHLTRFEKGQIPWGQFEEDALAGFHKPIRDKFRATYDIEGKERALRFIGRLGSDETNFIYGRGHQPMWMQNPLLKPFGMFGTWPMWGAELYLSRIKAMTPAQRAGFAMRTAALGAAFANLGFETGVNVWSWIAPTSVFGFGGGPAVENLINLREIQNAPMDRKASAARRLMDSGLRLAFPGQGFIADVDLLLSDPDPRNGMLRMILGRQEIDSGPFSMNYHFDPAADPAEDFTSPETKAILVPPWLADRETLFHVGSPSDPDARRLQSVLEIIH